ncbi:hypothetical protein R6Z07F_017679 [Ovis aries]
MEEYTAEEPRVYYPDGFQLSKNLLQLIILRYADQELQLGFDDFLNCLVRLENASRPTLFLQEVPSLFS